MANEQYSDSFSSQLDVFPGNKQFRVCFDPVVNNFRLLCKRQDLFKEVQDAFSIDNPQAFFSQQYGYKGQSKLLAINKFGYFAPGLVFEVLEWIKLHYGDLQLVAISSKCQAYIQDVLTPLKKQLQLNEISNVSEDTGRNGELRRLRDQQIASGMSGDEAAKPLEYRQYQQEAVNALLTRGFGRGLIEIPTAGGKSFILANFIWNIWKNVNRNFKCLIFVPNVQLVSQFCKDLVDYGLERRDLAMFTGGMTKKEIAENDISAAKIIIANRQYLFKNAAQLPVVDVLVCDEVHQCVAQASKDFIERCPAKIKVGCSGTLPKDKFQLWTLIGLIGRVVYREEVTSLQDQGYISKLKITLLDIFHRGVESNRNYLFHTNSRVKYHQDEFGQSEIFFNDAYKAEMEFFKSNYESLYAPIIDYLKTLPENTLVLFDSLDIGKSLFGLAQERLRLDKKGIYYIDGSQKVSVREDIRDAFEKADGNILFAQTTTFSTGVNIKRLTHIVFMFQSKSFSRIVQSIGRALRLHFSKKEAHVIDVKFNFKYSSKHYNERLKYYKDVYGKSGPDETLSLEI